MNGSDTTLDWELIGNAARALGVRDKNIEKWRQRKSVPHKWRIAIVLQTRGLVPLNAFDRTAEPAP